jgi:hypothetical protein
MVYGMVLSIAWEYCPYTYFKPLKLKCRAVEMLTFKDYSVQSIWHTMLKPCKHKFYIYVNLIMRVDWKVRVHSEYLLILQLLYNQK